MNQDQLKALCKFAKTYNIRWSKSETMKGWRDTIIRSQNKGFTYVDYAPGCQLKQFVRNIAELLYTDHLRLITGSEPIFSKLSRCEREDDVAFLASKLEKPLGYITPQ